jgi:hypothetical protein
MRSEEYGTRRNKTTGTGRRRRRGPLQEECVHAGAKVTTVRCCCCRPPASRSYWKRNSQAFTLLRVPGRRRLRLPRLSCSLWDRPRPLSRSTAHRAPGAKGVDIGSGNRPPERRLARQSNAIPTSFLVRLIPGALAPFVAVGARAARVSPFHLRPQLEKFRPIITDDTFVMSHRASSR